MSYRSKCQWSRWAAADYAADQTGWACGALYQISFWVEALHSFLTFTVGPAHPFCEASWLRVCTEAPPATLEKPRASDSHCLAPLVCSVWPVPLEEEREPITSRCWDQYDVIFPLRHNRLQMRGAEPLCSLIHLTKRKRGYDIEYPWTLTFFSNWTHSRAHRTKDGRDNSSLFISWASTLFEQDW